MLEQELDYRNEIFDFDSIIESQLSNQLGFEVELGESLIQETDERLNLMHSNERVFANFLLSKKLIVFPEPYLTEINRTPDFFVINPMRYGVDESYIGRFLELTLLSAKDLENDSWYGRTKFARKQKQKVEFESLNIPVSYICREQQECIKRFQKKSFEGIDKLF
jgi:hypothetical protein